MKERITLSGEEKSASAAVFSLSAWWTADVEWLTLGSHVEIIRLDLVEGTPHLILHVLAPNTDHDNSYIHPKICGDLASIGINRANQVLLVKLSTAEAILFAINENDLALINDHMVTARPDKESGALRLDVFAEKSLQQL